AFDNARAHLEAYRHDPADPPVQRALLPMPAFHSFGLVAGVLATLASGGTLFAASATPEIGALLGTIAAEAVDTLYLTPTLARLLTAHCRRKRPPALPDLRRVSIGSASMTRGELAELMAHFPDTQFFFTYGLTEMG